MNGCIGTNRIGKKHRSTAAAAAAAAATTTAAAATAATTAATTTTTTRLHPKCTIINSSSGQIGIPAQFG